MCQISGHGFATSPIRLSGFGGGVRYGLLTPVAAGIIWQGIGVGMFRLTGRVTNYVEEPWDFQGRTGVVRKVTVMVAEAFLITVRVRENYPQPSIGDPVDWAVSATENNGRTRLIVEGEYSRVVPSAPASGAPTVEEFEVPV